MKSSNMYVDRRRSRHERFKKVPSGGQIFHFIIIIIIILLLLLRSKAEFYTGDSVFRWFLE